MFNFLNALKGSLTKVKSATANDWVFRLHYFTAINLLAISFFISSKQYFGDPIDCIKVKDIRENLIDQYCWVSSTITVPNACKKNICLDNYISDEDQIQNHQYYQWVFVMLFLQSIMFYFPHHLWKIWEGGRLKVLVTDLDGLIIEEEVVQRRVTALKKYFQSSFNKHNGYAYSYSFCETLNFINVVGQMFLINRFLGGTFLDYGTKVIQFTFMDQVNRTDPMVMVFPRVTQCIFHTFGPSGTSQIHNTLCVLPLNTINEKIYIILWFWLIILAFVSGLAIIYRLVTILSMETRYQVLKSAATLVESSAIAIITNKLNFDDWFLVYLLAKNINGDAFKRLADIFIKQLDKSDSNTELIPLEKVAKSTL
ncbi:hypothetical protein CHUAL_006683 [Chamberlinius hualienensis]